MSSKLTLFSALALLTSAAPNATQINWIDCSKAIPPEVQALNVSVASVPDTLKCGTLNVPRDHSKPLSDDNQIELGLSIYSPGGKNASRLLNWNPGGPGLAATPYPWYLAFNTTEAQQFQGLSSDFTFLGIDPRSVGFSTPLNCSSPINVGKFGITKEDQYNKVQNATRQFASSCQPQNLLPYLTSADTAHDWDLVREALGYDKMSVLGYSYGTRYASEYLRLHADKVEHAVLDAAFSPGLTDNDLVKPQMRAATDLIERADAFCMVDKDCPFHDAKMGGLIKAFSQIMKQAQNNTLGNITPDDIVGTLYASFTKPDFPQLALGLEAAMNNKTDELDYNKNLEPLISKSFAAGLPTLCADQNYNMTYEQYDAVIKDMLTVDKYDLKATETSWFMAVCAAWPIKTNADPSFVNNSVPFMLVTSDFDWNTPAEWAFKFWENAPNSTLVVRHGDNHGSFYVPGPTRDAEFTYLDEGKLPSVVDNKLITVYTHDKDDKPKTLDPYKTVLGLEAGDESSVTNITFSADSATDGAKGEDSNGAGRVSVGSVAMIAGLLLAGLAW